MKRLLFIAILLQFGIVSAQKGKPGEGRERPKIGELKGIIKDSTSSEIVEFATISIFNIKDSSIVTGGISGEDGSFHIKEIPVGKYSVRISFIGYMDKYFGAIVFKPENPIIDMKTVQISNSQDALDEIEIVAEKAELELKIDRKVFNVEKNITSTGGSVNDILNNIPSVEVDMDGNISLRGSGNVTVLIDGKPSSMTGGGRTAILTSIPASSVESIEVITNPSAKYDPDGMSGIINIILKKNKLKGITTGIDLSAGTGNTYNASGNFNYRNEHINFFSNYSFRHYQGFRNLEQKRETTFGDTINYLDQDRDGTDLNESHMLKLGLDYYLNKRNTIGIAVTGNLSRRDRQGFMKYNEYNSIDTSSAFWTRDTYDPGKRNSLDFNFNYQHKFKNPKHNILVDINQSIGTNLKEGFYTTQYYTDDLTPIDDPSKQQVVYDDKNNFFSGTFDYVNPIKKNMKIESGFKATIRNNDRGTYNEYYDYDSILFVPNDSLNNLFRYNEQIYAAYGIFSHSVGKEKRFSYQIGIRLEQALILSKLVTTNESFRNDYFSWFPSAHLTYKLGEKKNSEFSLSYSKRINRPSSHSLNPFPNYSDPLNVRKGNPFLNPEYIHSTEFGFAHYSKIITVTTSVYFRYMTNMIQRVLIVEDNGVNLKTWSNVDNGINYGIEAVLIVKPLKWWNMNFSFNLYQVIFNDNSNAESDLNNAGLGWSVKFSSSMYFFKRTLEFQVNANYSAPRPISQGTILARYNIDLAAKKWFLNKQLAVGIRVSDILNSKRFEIEYSESNQNNYTKYKWETRRFYINFTWRFGNLKQKRGRGGYSGGSSGGGMGM